MDGYMEGSLEFGFVASLSLSLSLTLALALCQWLPLVAYTCVHPIITPVFLESVRQINHEPQTKSSPFRLLFPEETRILYSSARFR